MRAFDPEVVDAVWDAVAALLPAPPVDDHPLARGTATGKKLVPLGMRWPIERTNSWLSNFGQLRRNGPKDRPPPRTARPRRRVAHHRQTHRLARPVEPMTTPIRAGSKP